MNKLRGAVSKLTQLSAPPAPSPQTITTHTASGKDKYRAFRKEGPELFLTRILMVNGPLTNKEIWRIYERRLFEARQAGTESDLQYWPSLTKMKDTLKFMRINEKIVSGGYSYKDRAFKGWKIQEKRALKFVHPVVIAEIQKDISERENL